MEFSPLTYKLIEDSWTLHMAIISIAISIITLLYSLAIGKREELKILSDADKFGRNDPIIDAKISASLKYINLVKKTISSCNLVLTLSVINAVLSWICARFYICQIFIGAIIVLFLIIISIIASLLRQLIRQYKRDLLI
jgi:uncharacterized membrane protein YcjF (UPF0283 family)